MHMACIKPTNGCERAASLLEELKAENNYVTRMWSGAGIPVQTAADSQALLQLQKEYCDKKKCLYAVSAMSI